MVTLRCFGCSLETNSSSNILSSTWGMCFPLNYFSLKILKNNQLSLIETTVSLKSEGSLQVFFFDDTMAQKDFPQELIVSLLFLDFQSFG